jgi:hypothetical protein
MSSKILLLCVVLMPFAHAASGQEADKDWKNVPLKDLGLEPVKPTKDPKTGFLVGGKNDTALIGKLTEINGRSIADLEKDMRPGVSSGQGFLGAKESLLEILAEDNDFVNGELGLTHQELARHLHVLGKVAAKKKGEEIIYHGRAFKLTHFAFRGFQESPFKDGTKTNEEAVVLNVATGKKLRYSLLVPAMIERYGFYEGKGTSFRVDPRQVVEVLDFLKKK